MAKDNFDFDTESKGKLNLEFGFLKNLTQKQKEMILMIAIGVVALIIIVVIGVVMITGNGGNSGGGNIGGGTSDNGSSENGDGENGGSENGGNEDETPNVPDQITVFYISASPEKTYYYVGEEADYSGLTVFLKDTDNSSIVITYTDDPDAFTITGFDSSAPVEEQTITVECRGFTDTFTISVIERETSAPKPVSIHFTTYPKQVYSADDKFSYKGGVLVCTYSDDSTVEISLKLNYIYGTENIFDPTNEHILLPGEHTLVVEYTENGVSVYTEYTITVN